MFNNLEFQQKVTPSKYLLPLVHIVNDLRIPASIMGIKVFPPQANIQTI